MDQKKKTNGKINKGNAGLMALLRPYRWMILILIFFTLAGNGANLIIPLIIAYGIDSFEAGNYVAKEILLGFASAALIISLFTYLQYIMQTFASEKVARDLRNRLSDKISRQDFLFVQKTDPAKLLTYLTSDIDSIKNFVSHAVASIVSSIFIIIGITVLLLTINWKLALAIIAIIPIITFSFFLVMKKVRPYFKRSREIIDNLNKVISESIIGAAIIRVLNSQMTEYEKFVDSNKEARSIGISILKFFAVLIPIIFFVANMAILVVLVLGGRFVILNSMTLGEFTAFNSYISLLIFPIIVIGFMSQVIAQASASYNRVYEVLNKPDVEVKGEIKEVKGDIEFQNVYLEYDGKSVLKNISFKLNSGNQIAIIGPTAAGKSLLLYLLTGLIKHDSGRILVDGNSIDEFDPIEFYSQVSTVFQESIIFNLSLGENIAFGNKVSEEAMQKAIETAELREYINGLPKRFDTNVSERGSSLSGGQKQRIMLARALAMNPKILLLDDFTSRVDRQTEKNIQCNLMKNYPDITLLSVSQKIASVKHFDHIILLMEGEIIAQGKHKDLLASCPEYIQIYNSQLSTSHYEL